MIHDDQAAACEDLLLLGFYKNEGCLVPAPRAQSCLYLSKLGLQALYQDVQHAVVDRHFNELVLRLRVLKAQLRVLYGKFEWWQVNSERILKMIALHLGIASLLVTGLVGSAAAAEITRTGTTVVVRGRIEAGDDLKFAAVAPQGSYRAVDLSSIGGDLSVAGPIARNIKATGAVTIYDAARGPCSSACTVLFVAGTGRHYVNSGNIREGIGRQGKQELGFHEARSYDAGNRGRAMGNMAALDYEMGCPLGVELSSRSPNQTAYYISGATAMSTGVATSLARP